ncbi:ATP-grasp domain-containing protein [Haloferax sp. DFSO52]|uniref:carboxylate--amine ligase n=1 Tax=Haloferax sp. DFSO52 TaxID=3388505 RepID=UPI003A87037B
MTTVLVTDGQTRSALAIARSLGRHGVRVVCGESTRLATTFASKHVDERFVYPDPRVSPDAFISTLLRYLQTHDIDVLLPVDHESTYLINKHRGLLAEHTLVPVAGADKFDRLVQKDLVMQQAARLGIPHPRTVYPKSADEAVELAAVLTFPVVVKPRTSAGAKGVQYVDDPSSLRQAYHTASQWGPNPIVQEQIPQEGRGMGAAFLRWDGEIIARFEYQRLREFPPSGGASTLRESIHDDRLFEAGKALLEDVDWQGVAMVEFKNDPRTDTPQLLEVNPRFWGSLHLPYRSGVEFPWLLVQCALGDAPDPVLTYPAGDRCRYLLPGDLINLFSRRDMDALREFFPLVEPGVSFDILDRSDPLPAVAQLLVMAREAVTYVSSSSSSKQTAPPPTMSIPDHGDPESSSDDRTTITPPDV